MAAARMTPMTRGAQSPSLLLITPMLILQVLLLPVSEFG